VQVGAARTSVPYAWPDAVLRPAGESIWLAYLDLNQWIRLARAASGHPVGRKDLDLLQALRSAHQEGRLLCPLSSVHYMETAAIRDPRQRQDIATVMEDLSDFRTLLNRGAIVRLELETALDDLIGPNPVGYPAVPLLGIGLGHAFGRRGGLLITNEDGTDVTAQARQEWPEGPEAFDSMKQAMELQFERALLAGPQDYDVEALRVAGWDPMVARRGNERRAEQEREQAERFAREPRWRLGRIRDVISGRYLAFEIDEMLIEAVTQRGVRLGDICADVNEARRLVDCMPSSDVWITLVTARHRNPTTRWTANDMFDIDAMSLAVAYCDVVVTDKQVAHDLNSAGVPGRVGTPVLTMLPELLELLEGAKHAVGVEESVRSN
jgi:hypothetical protein